MTLTRVLRAHAATLSHTFYVGETATDPTGTPTYAIVDANGTAVASGNATVVGGDTGRVTAPLASQASLSRLTVTWTATVAAGTVIETDTVEIVGGFFFTLAQGRASDTSLSDASTYPLADLIAAQLETECECEFICDRAFVPRYDRVVLDGTGTSQILLRHSQEDRSVAHIRTLRRIAVADQLDETFTDLSAADLAEVSWSGDGTLTRVDGGTFTEGRRNVVVEYEYGLDAPPADLVRQSMTRFRTWLNANKSGIPDRTTSFSIDGGVYRYDMPGPYKTGIPDMDAIYGRYSRRSTGSGPTARTVPASRSLVYTPQRYSMFHGRR